MRNVSFRIGDVMGRTDDPIKRDNAWTVGDGRKLYVVVIDHVRVPVWAHSPVDAFSTIVRVHYEQRRLVPPAYDDVMIRLADDDEMATVLKRRRTTRGGDLASSERLFDPTPTRTQPARTPERRSVALQRPPTTHPDPPPDPWLESLLRPSKAVRRGHEPEHPAVLDPPAHVDRPALVRPATGTQLSILLEVFDAVGALGLTAAEAAEVIDRPLRLAAARFGELRTRGWIDRALDDHGDWIERRGIVHVLTADARAALDQPH